MNSVRSWDRDNPKVKTEVAVTCHKIRPVEFRHIDMIVEQWW
jgi:hypothetical protein